VLLFGRPASAASGAGHPDLFGIARTRFLALEIKKARGKPTPRQVMRLHELRQCGAYAWIVRSPHEAVEAVYWAAKGWTRPMPDEPLDLSQWLMGDPAKTEAEPFAPAAEQAPPEAPEGDPFNMRIPPEQWDTPEHQEAAARVLGYDSAEQRNEALNGTSQGQPSDEELFTQTVNLLTEYVQKLDKDLRTVGDRVTIVWERQEMFLSVLQAVDAKLGKLLALVEEDPEPETIEPEPEPTPVPAPRQRRSRSRKTQFEIVGSEPKPPANGSDLGKALEDILPS
jgi:hypothetical protein